MRILDVLRQRPTSSDTKRVSDLSRDLQNTAYFFSAFMGLGLLFVWLHVESIKLATTPLLWALACSASGAAIGFLFGIPKILQGDVIASTELDSASSAVAPQPRQHPVYRQRVNTNLEEISDWLTKIIVGLGLINLTKIPPKLNQAADILANDLTPTGQRAFALAIIIYFSVVGLLYGYLFTRLFLQRAFARADLAVMTSQEILRQEIDRVTKRAFQANPQAGKELTEEQVEGAEQVARVALQSDISVVRQQISDLTREYESIRASMPSGNLRSRRMEVIITKMRTLAFAAYPLLPELTHSSSPGQRLAAVAILQVKPDPSFLDWLAARLAVEKPFVGYHAAVALQYAVHTLDASDHEHLIDAIRKAKAGLAQDTDRYQVLEQAEKDLLSGHHIAD